MSKTMKKVVSLVLVVVMLAAVCLAAVSCNNNKEAVKDTYTYNSYTSSLGTNWNPHTWETNGDRSIMSYIETPLTDITVKDSTTGEYQWIFVAAESVTDVTADHQDDLVKYGADQTDATEGYVYEIKLRPEMCWENGTPINADTYVYSMKAMLDPAMKNYRANNYYSGESAIAGAVNYYYQGSVATLDNGATGELTALTDLVKGEDGVYTTAAGLKAWICVAGGLDYLDGYSMKTYYDAYGCFDATSFDALLAQADENGCVPVTDDNWALLCTAINVEDWGYEDETCAPYYVLYEKEYEACEYDDTVGLYKVDDYTIRYVCATSYDYYYFLTSCTSNWIVYEELYEACKKQPETADGLVTSTYATSKDTTMSYGPYRIDSLQEDKQIVYVQNENYFEFTKNEDGSLTSTTEAIGFKVDGEYVDQYMTQKIIVDVMTDDAAKLAFLSGQIDDWTPAADEVVNYSTSEQLYQVDETYTMRLFFNTDLEALKDMDTKNNQNSVVMSNYNFRKALSLAIDRSEFVTATAGYKAAYYLINSLYFYDVYEDPASIYRNTEEAMQAVCNIYGVQYGEGTPYATLEEAYKSVNGFNLTEAKALMKTACEELVEAGLYNAGDKIVIEMGWKNGANDSTDHQQVALLNQYINAAIEGSGFGTIELKAIDNLTNRYADVASGAYAIGWGAWGGAAFYPFTMFRVYCDPSYTSIHEAGCWDPASETLTLTVEGEEVTMTWQAWSTCMTGTGAYANASNEVKLSILAQIEENFIELYYCVPVCTTTVCSMLSYKISYYTENYSIMYGFGGLRLTKYNYSDAEWADYVASQNNNIAY